MSRDPENPDAGNPPPPPPPMPGFGRGPGRMGYRRLEEDDELLIPRPSILLPHLQDSEKRFFELVHSGDVAAVNEFLSENPGFNINCVNFQGVSGLLIAVQSRSEPMVEFLLSQQDIDIGDCVLHAIRDNQPKILELLLEKQRNTAPSLEYVGVTHSSDFPDYVTPLILAAQCGHYEIIELLIDRGHTIGKPHSPSCRCMDCKAQLERDDLLHAEHLRLNLYKSVCNPAYICHSSRDPILTSFQLSAELRQCSFLVPEFRNNYLELATEVSNFAVELIAGCRNSGEVETILKQKAGIQNASIFMYPRLVLAMDYKQKFFVAHAHIQHIVESLWRGNWYDYNLKPIPAKIVYPIFRILLLPIIVVMCIFMPRHQMVEHWNIPLNRMINHVAAFLVFLVLIFLESNQSKEKQKRLPPNSGLEPVIIIFVVGNCWSVVRMCLIQGPRRYFTYLWNWHAVISNTLFILTFVFWLASYVDAVNNDQVDLERKYWHHLDPVLIAEGTFAVAVVMTYFKLMFYCRLNYYLGPLQISLGKMCTDMAKYITIFIIIIISFTAGLCRFYNYYDGMVQVDSNGIKTAQVSSFIDFSTTLKTFFWAVFCMAPLETGDVIIENLPGDTENTTIINKHLFTEAVGYIAFALFEVLTVVMILNMLIATMSSTFQRVLDNIDVEWTFGKTDFYLEYMLQSTLPPPLNLIPTPSGISAFMEWFQSPKVDPREEEKKNDYPALMSQLVQRYFRDKDSATSPENDLEFLKQEIAEIKQAVNDLLEKE
ncbi:short transient receptor potential channel 4-like isoform X1 [Tribolium madens]|uniref:short transient receptor potential channel 4-like isoform X1 n=1 Tax=Tribolium madens TaxID=41895 RepID=UPI001CF732D5|nr:short transient receptor potential channel 4-like isoform X1 [Tribolium madens]